jgi:hypothetical protein
MSVADDNKKLTVAELKRFKRRVDLRGLAAINRHSPGARDVVAWRDELRAACGGTDLSPQREMLVELAGRTRVLLDVVDTYLMTLPTIINRRYKKLMPIILQRNQLAESLQKTLDRLGLDRRAKPIEDLDAYLERRGEELVEERQKTDEATADNH